MYAHVRAYTIYMHIDMYRSETSEWDEGGKCVYYIIFVLGHERDDVVMLMSSLRNGHYSLSECMNIISCLELHLQCINLAPPYTASRTVWYCRLCALPKCWSQCRCGRRAGRSVGGRQRKGRGGKRERRRGQAKACQFRTSRSFRS